MNSSAQVPVAHRFAHFAKGWSIARGATVLLCAAMALNAGHAQSCGITSVTETGTLVYPPIARAAHVQGPVVLLATFALDGSVSAIKIISAPLLLDQLMGRVAAEYVKTWKANTYGGPRECPIVVDFALGPEANDPKSHVARIDAQHIRITAETYHPTVNYSIASIP